jgi:cell division protein FtsB
MQTLPPEQDEYAPIPRPLGRRTGQLSGLQIMFAAILAIGLILGLNFTSLISSAQPLNQLYGDVTTQIAVLQQQRATLIAERDFAASDAYIEQWAHSDGKMVRPGERLIVPVPLASSLEMTPLPTPSVVIETRPPANAAWKVWWQLFFDGEPPDFSGQGR